MSSCPPSATDAQRLLAQPEGAGNMLLTKDFKTTVQARVARDPRFRMELLREGVGCLLAGDLETCRVLLRGYINARPSTSTD
jgi:hypothetical protein